MMKMKTFKAFMALVITVSLFTTMTSMTAFAANSNGVNRHIYDSINIGAPISSVDILHSAFGEVDGKHMMYTTIQSKPSAKFVAFNIDENKVEFIADAKFSDTYASKGSWSHKIAPDGTVYMVPHGYISLYKYNPRTKEFTNSGAPLPGLTAAYGLCLDDENNIYFGGYPVSNIYKFDSNLKLVKEYGEAFPNEKYVMSMVYYNGFLYAGGQAPGTKFMKIDAKTGKKTEIPATFNGQTFDITSYYMMDRINNLIFITAKLATGSYQLLVYDAEKGSWVFTYNRSYGHYMAPEKNGKTYMIAEIPNDPSKKTGLVELDLKTFETKYTGIPFYGNLTGSGWVELKNHPELPGESLLTFSRESQALIAFNLEAKKVVVLDEMNLPAEANHIQDLESGINNTLLMGSYMGSYMRTYDVNTGEMKKYKSTQTEKIKRYGNIAYAGCYTQAALYEYDLTKEPSDSNPKQLGYLGGKNQDRIFDICKIDDNLIAVGTYPRTGFDTGGLGIFDKSKGAFDFYDNVCPGQSVDGVAYKDGIIYGATSIYVNVANKPTDEAYVFAFSLADRKVIKKTPVKINGSTIKNKIIGDLEIGPDGNLWGITTGGIFCMDPKTLEVKKSVVADKMVADRRTMSTISHLYWDEDGYLYAVCNGFLIILNPETMEFKHTKKSMQYFAFGEDGNVYYSNFSNNGHILSKFTVSALNEEAFKNVTEAVSGGVAMMLNSNIASVNGDAKYIDSNDKSIVAKEIDGRTRVPVRFISESFGAQVGWDDSTQTATISLSDTTVKIKIGDNKLDINGEIKEMDVSAITENGRTLLPLRAISEALGKDVFWDDRGLIVITTDKGKVTADQKELVDNLVLFVKKDMPRLLSGTNIISK